MPKVHIPRENLRQAIQLFKVTHDEVKDDAGWSDTDVAGTPFFEGLANVNFKDTLSRNIEDLGDEDDVIVYGECVFYLEGEVTPSRHDQLVYDGNIYEILTAVIPAHAHHWKLEFRSTLT